MKRRRMLGIAKIKIAGVGNDEMDWAPWLMASGHVGLTQATPRWTRAGQPIPLGFPAWLVGGGVKFLEKGAAKKKAVQFLHHPPLTLETTSQPQDGSQQQNQSGRCLGEQFELRLANRPSCGWKVQYSARRSEFCGGMDGLDLYKARPEPRWIAWWEPRSEERGDEVVWICAQCPPGLPVVNCVKFGSLSKFATPSPNSA
ncbi:hypothetical protein B0T18DRAFT_408675 [Schizothecium vesticola]|uniref:Uncharacterized protein n=1 Tax=Schizothecium vesticola TaxID=314040 RepID=A0AA40K8V7_9PEZI|nr:hypothetical protein B0T18DRAFT_408675 [Schizothecium vesticola]